MALGDITSTYEGTFNVNDAALITELDTLNTGAATVGADITEIKIIPADITGSKVHIFTLARAAA